MANFIFQNYFFLNLLYTNSFKIEAEVEDQSMLNVSISRTHPDPLSTHILDTTTGLPAREVEVSLFRMGGAGGGGPNSSWMQINTK